MMSVNWQAVHDEMVRLENETPGELAANEVVMARLLGLPDEEGLPLGAQAMEEVKRVGMIAEFHKRQYGLPKNTTNSAALGFLQGLTFAVAYRNVAEHGDG